jgi:hypothetical protein
LSESLPVSVYPIDSKPCGLTYGEWSAKWWKWFLSIPKKYNPAFDLDGSNAGTNQSYLPVFFLCQTYENTDILPCRTLAIPMDSLIFMPIINWISIMHHDGETDQQLLTIAKNKMNVVTNLELIINGIPVEKGLDEYRAVSPFFDVELPEDNIVGLSPGVRRAVSDGFWFFIKPRENMLELISTGACSSGLTKIGAKYRINLV